MYENLFDWTKDRQVRRSGRSTQAIQKYFARQCTPVQVPRSGVRREFAPRCVRCPRRLHCQIHIFLRPLHCAGKNRSCGWIPGLVRFSFVRCDPIVVDEMTKLTLVVIQPGLPKTKSDGQVSVRRIETEEQKERGNRSVAQNITIQETILNILENSCRRWESTNFFQQEIGRQQARSMQ